MKNKICKQSGGIVDFNYKLCTKCYFKNKNDGKLALQERLKERNYIEDGIGIITDTKGRKWEVTLEEFELAKDILWQAVYTNSPPACNNKEYLYKFVGRTGNNKKKTKVTYKDKPRQEWSYKYRIIEDTRKKKNIMTIYMGTSPSGKSYIGKTTDKLNNRISRHKRDFNEKYKFACAIRKYGFENFKWEVLDQTYDYEELNALEIYYIRLYNTIENGYNHNVGGDIGSFGLKASPEAIEKSRDRIYIRELVAIYDKEGILIKTVHKIREAVEFTKVPKDTVSFAVKDRIKLHHGFIFRRVDPDDIPQKLELPKNYHLPLFMYPFDVYKNDEYIGRWESQKQCGIDLKIPKTSISAVLNGRQKTGGEGYVFKRV